MRVIEFLLNLVGWFQIVLGCTLAGALVAGAVYYFDHGAGRVTGIILVPAGFIMGAFWATRIWIRHGTTEWLSGIRQVK
jgi:hypothetical protein